MYKRYSGSPDHVNIYEQWYYIIVTYEKSYNSNVLNTRLHRYYIIVLVFSPEDTLDNDHEFDQTGYLDILVV